MAKKAPVKKMMSKHIAEEKKEFKDLKKIEKQDVAMSKKMKGCK